MPETCTFAPSCAHTFPGAPRNDGGASPRSAVLTPLPNTVGGSRKVITGGCGLGGSASPSSAPCALRPSLLAPPPACGTASLSAASEAGATLSSCQPSVRHCCWCCAGAAAAAAAAAVAAMAAGTGLLLPALAAPAALASARGSAAPAAAPVAAGRGCGGNTPLLQTPLPLGPSSARSTPFRSESSASSSWARLVALSRSYCTGRESQAGVGWGVGREETGCSKSGKAGATLQGPT
jgi:hypothetical protein